MEGGKRNRWAGTVDNIKIDVSIVNSKQLDHNTSHSPIIQTQSDTI